MDTKCFSTQNASGSTSQAANVVEAIETEAKVLLIDEDTSATNFMIRDSLMQMVVSKDKEPITPYIDKVRDLYDFFGISTILVVGSSGEYFNKADTIIQLEDYNVYDITNNVRDITKNYISQAKNIVKEKIIMPDFNRKIHQHKEWIEDRIKVRGNGKDTININKDSIDTRYLEQLVDEEQLKMIGYLFVYMNNSIFDGNICLQSAVEKVYNLLDNSDLNTIFGKKMVPCNLAIQENRNYPCVSIVLGK